MDDEESVTIAHVLDRLRTRLPEVSIERLTPKWPGDDDNLWYVRLGDTEVQVECRPNGRPPFLIEGDDVGQRMETTDADEAVATIAAWLRPD